MSKFQTSNLDMAYTHIKAMYNTATGDGQTLANDFARIINNLMLHWEGSDATLHINNLITMYQNFCPLIGDISRVAHNVSIPIVEAQEIRQANGGSGNVDSVISEHDVTMTSFDPLPETDKYNVDPDGAKADYNDLSTLCNDFNRLQNTFTEHKNNVLDVWTAGSDRENSINIMDEFLANAVKCYRAIADAASNLQIATKNFESLATANLSSN